MASRLSAPIHKSLRLPHGALIPAILRRDTLEVHMTRSALAAEVGSDIEHRNEITLSGRLAAVSADRRLPSGDVLVGFRVVVDRPVSARRPGSRGTRVDVVDCHVLRPRLRRLVHTFQLGDIIEVQGSLRRRFFRAASALGSRYEVEATGLRRLERCR